MMPRVAVHVSAVLICIGFGGLGCGSAFSTAATKAQTKIHKGTVSGSPAMGTFAIYGARKPSVVVVEVSDFQCPFCAMGAAAIKQVVSSHADEVALVWVHMPLSFHKDALDAAMASEAALAQGKFWEMHDLLFEGQSDLSDEALVKHAETLGLDRGSFLATMNDSELKERIEQQSALLSTSGIQGTPTFIINGTIVPGALPAPKLMEIVEAELAIAKAKGIASTSVREVLWASFPEEARPFLDVLFGAEED